MRLISRLVLFMLSEENITKIDHQIYFDAITKFVQKITGEKSPFYMTDKVLNKMGQYLLDQHDKFIKDINVCLQSMKEFKLPKQTINFMIDYLTYIKKIIQRQLIAYLDSAQDSASMGDMTYTLTLQKLERKLISEMDKQTSTNSLQKRSPEDTSKLVLTAAKRRNHQYYNTLEQLYALLHETENLLLFTNDIKGLFDTISWITLFSDSLNLKLNRLADYLEVFHQKAEGILNAKSQQPRLSDTSKGFTALLRNTAADLSTSTQVPQKITALVKKLENQALHDRVRAKIAQHINGILQGQEALGIEDILSLNKDQQAALRINASVSNTYPAIMPSMAPDISQQSYQSLYQPEGAEDTPDKRALEWIPEPNSKHYAALYEIEPERDNTDERVDGSFAQHGRTAYYPSKDIFTSESESSDKLQPGEFTIQGKICSFHDRQLNKMSEKQLENIFEAISRLPARINRIAFTKNGFNHDDEQSERSLAFFTEMLPQIPPQIVTLDFRGNGFELFNRTQLGNLFSGVPSTVKDVYLYGATPQSIAVWLKRVDWPASYGKITRQAYLNNNVFEIARILLDDYTKGNSVSSRFFTGHWNRHYIDKVTKIVGIIDGMDASEEQDRPLDKNLLAQIKAIKVINQCGSLARRISYIESINAEVITQLQAEPVTHNFSTSAEADNDDDAEQQHFPSESRL
jgi:hypothetical protein